jgi:mono/diheme cytochrome c family protein
MLSRWQNRLRVSCALLAASAAVGCAQEDYPQWVWDARHPQPATSVPTSSQPDLPQPTAPAETCVAARSSQPLPARLSVMSRTATSSRQSVFVDDVFHRFDAICGGCHVQGGLGGFHTGPLDFADKVGQKAVDRILSTDPSKSMPPVSAGGKLASARGPDDPVLALATLLQAWLAAGSPRDVFYIEAASTDAEPSSYLLSKSVGEAMTNLGNCIPARSAVATDSQQMSDLDTRFAALQKSPPGQGTPAERVGLPEKLSDTDLWTLDSDQLAKSGVFAFAPGYPLWSDDAGKLRHVRVPHGKSVRFDKRFQTFDIPENTRFYKTFLRQVIDVDGKPRYRKVETRLIVARPDATEADGSARITSLYGTYAWNDDETEAELVTDPLRNGEPFGDRLLTLVVDEPTARKVRAKKPKNLSYALRNAGAVRHYAIPGSERCVQCHMGSPTKSFSLGFLPLQLKRRAAGEGGAIEPTGPDEAAQLERLVEFGVVSGVDSLDDVVALEDAEALPPRNDYELKAQGYMFGNCAHCHNPRGFPTVRNPVLASVLNFLPSKQGGIFGFPLNGPGSSSPRITRGISGTTPVPYITPSLYDLPVLPDAAGSYRFYQPKADLSSEGTTPAYIILAPWRSLLYRNVDSPFTYADDLALFPHMPMNSPGFDCRAAQILGDWMVSIPAVRKSPEIPEDGQRIGDTLTSSAVDDNPQPYFELKPGDDGYEAAQHAAETRLQLYHDGKAYADGQPYSRYGFCPDTSDIVDPEVLSDPEHQPVPQDHIQGVVRGSPPSKVMPRDGVPDHAHWVVTDLTEVQGDWNPRRPDWQRVLADGFFPAIHESGSALTLKLARQAKEQEVVSMLTGAAPQVDPGDGGVALPRLGDGVVLTSELRSFLTTSLPFGLWQKKPACNFGSVTTAGSLAEPLPQWITQAKVRPSADAAIYSVLPGEAVFGMICINCHGAQADSHGRQADILVTMTGGDARVANLRDGLFGGSAGPGSNRQRVFGEQSAAEGLSVDDWGARYMAWMALGGTQQTIPSSILAIVSNTQVLGVARTGARPPPDANMLATAQNLCKQALPIDTSADPTNVAASDFVFDPKLGYAKTSLIHDNGDAELWTKLCAIDNPRPLRVLTAYWGSSPGTFHVRPNWDFYSPANYPANAPVGDARGHVVAGIADDNPVPWCLRVPRNPQAAAVANAWVDDPAHYSSDGAPLPFCPKEVVPPSPDYPGADGHLSINELQRWGTRGAINAGFAVFVYLDQLMRGNVKPKPAYDHCELLQ